MSIRFGAIRQIAYVVDDIDRAMDYWSATLGVGPWFVRRRIDFVDYAYRGAPGPSPVISLALANSGAQQIELIEQHDETPSIYLESLKRGPSRFHHVSSWLTDAAFDVARARLIAEGVSIAMEGRLPSSGVRVAYWATDAAEDGFFYEMATLDEPTHRARVERIRKAAENWDGVDPVIEAGG